MEGCQRVALMKDGHLQQMLMVFFITEKGTAHWLGHLWLDGVLVAVLVPSCAQGSHVKHVIVVSPIHVRQKTGSSRRPDLEPGVFLPF